MLDKIKTIIQNPYWQNLRDIRALGLIAFAVIVLLTSWSSVRIIETNFELQRDIAKLEQQNRLSLIQNDNLKLTNQYYQTDTYLELAARQYYNKGRKDEKLILVPKDVALARAPQLEATDKAYEEESTAKTQSSYQENFQAWLDFFFGRNI